MHGDDAADLDDLFGPDLNREAVWQELEARGIYDQFKNPNHDLEMKKPYRKFQNLTKQVPLQRIQIQD